MGEMEQALLHERVADRGEEREGQQKVAGISGKHVTGLGVCGGRRW